MKKSSIYGILSIVLIVGMFFTGCASKNNASQLNTNVSNLPIHQMHASFVYDTDNIREAVGICDYVFVAKVVSCDTNKFISNKFIHFFIVGNIDTVDTI